MTGSLAEILKAVVLGTVEGLTEWLPVSSTGHMILVDEFLRLGMSDAFKEMFRVVIQLGAIIAVVVLYWKRLFPFEFGRKQIGRAACRERVEISVDAVSLIRKPTGHITGRGVRD